MGQSLSSKKKVAVLGAGKMGSILLQSLLRDGSLSPGQTWATVAHAERARMLKDKLKVHAGTDNSEAVKDADIIFLCVKPQVVADVAREIRSHLNAKQLVISIAASVPTEMIERALEIEVPVVRAMLRWKLRVHLRRQFPVQRKRVRRAHRLHLRHRPLRLKVRQVLRRLHRRSLQRLEISRHYPSTPPTSTSRTMAQVIRHLRNCESRERSSS